MSKLLTPLELKVMNQMWRLEKAFVKEILQQWEDQPAPAYNTVSTTVRILEEKGFVDHEAFGRTHQYYPVVSKLAYQKMLLKHVVSNVFSGSMLNLVSTLVNDDQVSEDELNEIREMIKQAEE